MNVVMTPKPASEVEQHRRAVRRNPRDANAHALLGIALLRERQLEEGIAALRRALVLNPKIRGLLGVLAAALFEIGDYPAADECYRQALRFQDDADLHKGLGDTLLKLNRIDEAEASLRRAVAVAPGNSAMLLSLADVLNRQHRTTDTMQVLRRVLELSPDNTDVRYDLAYLLQGQQRYEEAIEHYHGVIANRPEHFNALRQMGLAYHALKQKEPAVEFLQRAAALKPDDADTLSDLGMTEQNRGNISSSVLLMRRALALQADHVHALRGLSNGLFLLGEWEEALALARRLLELDPAPATHSMFLFILSHCCLDGAELTREHLAYGERWEAPLSAPPRPHSNDRDPNRRLRIGLVSADLHNHAVSRFITPMFEAMKDSQQVSLYVYYNNTVEDQKSAHNRSLVTAWRPIAALSDEEADQLIRDDAIDILIDLSGHSALNRLPLFARKPAPVQATWIGYAGTTGMRSMDYILADKFQLPKGRYDDQFSEQIVRVPLGTPFLPEAGAPAVNPLPALTNGYLTFGSFHRASKLSRPVIAQWAKLLHAVPDSKMLLGGMQTGTDEVLIDWFEAEGIPRERLLLRERAPAREYMEQHYEVDIHLCPFPYTGSTTIGNALWMGVPTLATVGATNPSYAATVFMTHLGLNTFITENEETYVKLGVFLSQNLKALAAMRASMRERFLQSVLGYPGVAAASIELAWRRMWERWCAGETPAALSVELSDLLPESN